MTGDGNDDINADADPATQRDPPDDGTASDPTTGATGGTPPTEAADLVDPRASVPDAAALRTSAVVTSPGDTTVITRTVARVVVPLIAVLSISLLLQGHNLPGGGFIGGVLSASAFAVLFVVYGIDYVRDVAFPGIGGDRAADHGYIDIYRTMFGAGLGLAAGSGLVAILVGFPFLTQAVVFLKHVPIYGEVEVASALAFDLGVYFVVVGGLLTILGRVGEE